MESLKNTNVKYAFMQALMDEGRHESYKELSLTQDNKPIMRPHSLINDEEIDYQDVNEDMLASSFDLLSLNTNISELATEYRALVDYVELSLLDTKARLEEEKSRLEDVNILCSNYKDFNIVIPLSELSFNGNIKQYKNILTAEPTIEQDIQYNIINVNGNGSSDDNIYNITSTESNKMYFYKRYFSYDKDKASSSVHIDNIDAQLALTISSNQINELLISVNKETEILKVEVSNDLANWSVVSHDFNNSMTAYKYIYESGRYHIVFSSSNYVRITLKGTKVEEIKDTPNVYAKVIEVSQIVTRSRQFIEATGITDNLITAGSAHAVGIYYDLYLPSFMKSEASRIETALIVNSDRYNVIPLNEHDDGIKIIKNTNISIRNKYFVFIDAPITSLQLEVSIPTFQGYSPYIANLKVCLGRRSKDV